MSTTRVGMISLIVMSTAGFIGMLLAYGLLAVAVAGFASLDLRDKQTMLAIAICIIICLVLLVLGLVVWFKHRYLGLSIMVVVIAIVLGTLLVAVFVDTPNLDPASHAGAIQAVRAFIAICFVLLVLGVVGWFKHVRHIFLDDSRIKI